MLRGSGITNEGRPVVIVGLTTADCIQLLTGGGTGALRIDVAAMDPRLPDLQIVVVAGETEQAIGDALERRFPSVWRLDQLPETKEAP